MFRRESRSGEKILGTSRSDHAEQPAGGSADVLAV